MPSSSHSSALPSVGPPLTSWSASTAGRKVGVGSKRQQKLGLWSAVALQQHFTTTGGQRGSSYNNNNFDGALGGDGNLDDGADTEERSATAREDLRTHLGPAVNAAGHPHKPTLAQRMGLVPPPPPAPTADDWQVVVHRAMLRERQHQRNPHTSGGYGDEAHVTTSGASSACAICQMSFLATSDEGQVILSCSHVFHAQCFRAFERCVRAQQRADGAGIAEVTAQLACPVCRTQHYYKRVFYEGKAMTQRAAIVKVQSAIRGFLARRRYVQQRLRSNAAFRTSYVQARLARLSAAWSNFCAQQARQRETTLVALRAQHQAATAAYLSEADWTRIWATVVENAADTGAGAVAREGDVVIACPICLERIYETHFTQQRHSTEGKEVPQLCGDDAVAALRLAYEKRQKDAQAVKDAADKRKAGDSTALKKKQPRLQTVEKATTSPTSRKVHGLKARQSKALKGSAAASSNTLTAENAVAKTKLPSLPPPSSPTLPISFAGQPRSGVLLSCGHCFHEACIGCYEHFNEQRMTEAADDTSRTEAAVVVVADRCPICRAGYAKHPL